MIELAQKGTKGTEKKKKEEEEEKEKMKKQNSKCCKRRLREKEMVISILIAVRSTHIPIIT